jgi:hypothetical protein
VITRDIAKLLASAGMRFCNVCRKKAMPVTSRDGTSFEVAISYIMSSSGRW